MRARTAAIWLVSASVVAIGCARTELVGVPVDNLRPTVTLSVAPQPGDSVFYEVRFEWFALDEDGRVSHFFFAVDPPVEGDTLWSRTGRHEITLRFPSTTPPDPPPANERIASTDHHVFVIKAVDNEGAGSEPVHRAFTSWTVAPQTRIVSPLANRLLPSITPPSLTIRWEGIDPDGVSTSEPLLYKFKIASQAIIQDALGLGNLIPFPKDIQQFFEQEAPRFASWDSVPPEAPGKSFEGLSLGQTYYFAVVAFDEAGAYEPRFLVGFNVLRFLPSTQLASPRLTISNSFFFFEQPSGGFTTDESAVIRLDFVEGQPLVFDWFATPAREGGDIRGYRWVLDPPNQDITDETPREREEQTWRWSSWSLNETRATIGPFFNTDDGEERHRFYVEAIDVSGLITLVILEIRVLSPQFDRPILVFDDFRGPPDRFFGPGDPRNFQPYGDFPTEAVLDTLLYAVGDKPYRERPPGTLSKPGIFAGFDYDTLDYRFAPNPNVGVPLELLLRYETVVLYTGLRDAIRPASQVASALRIVNESGRLNTLALYVRNGGKLWIFGDGSLVAIARGFWGQNSRFPVDPIPESFFHGTLKARSRIHDGGPFPLGMTGATPYLPEFASPGRPWPPEGWNGFRGPADDPRVGPSAERNRERWDGLPLLTRTTEFPDWPVRLPGSIEIVPYVGLPNEILEVVSGPSGPSLAPALDTLYLYRRIAYSLDPSYRNADGKPVMLAYQGSEHGPVIWSNIPFWWVEREQFEAVADLVLGNFGYHRKPDPRTWTGPGDAHRHFVSSRFGVVERE